MVRFLDPVLGPLLRLDPLISILLISFLISLMIVIIYKRFTDQNLMKQLKSEIKELQGQMKKLRDNPKKMMEVQKKAMETNMKYMMQSFRPTLLTFIPIILIFGWLNSHMGYYPIVENTEFTITAQFLEGTAGSIRMIDVPSGISLLSSPQQSILAGKAEWVLKGREGTYSLRYDYQDQQFSHQLIITSDMSNRNYAKPELRAKDLGTDSELQQLVISNERIRPLQNIPLIGSLPWIGNFGWLGTYILFSIIFSIALRKLMKVY